MTTQSSLKIVFWGTSDFALPSLELLAQSGYKIVAVVTNPDEPKGRKQILTPPPVKVFGMRHGLNILQPKILTNYKLQITNYKPDLFIVASYGKIIPKKILDIPKFGALNLHPSLLPRWRGPSPIQYTVLNGDKETGVTIIKMDEKMDHGPILAQQELVIPKHKTQITKIKYPELHDLLASLGAKLLVETIPKYINGEIKAKPQHEPEATYSKILTKEDGRINWSDPAEKIERTVRAFNPWPGTWTTLEKDGKKIRIVVEEAEVLEKNYNQTPGFVWQDGPENLLVQTNRNSLKILRLRAEGRSSVNSADFLRGNRYILSAIFTKFR